MDALQVYQISVGLEYKLVSYSDFFKCAKRQRRKKKQTQKLESLLTHILKKLYAIFFKVSV